MHDGLPSMHDGKKTGAGLPLGLRDPATVIYSNLFNEELGKGKKRGSIALPSSILEDHNIQPFGCNGDEALTMTEL